MVQVQLLVSDSDVESYKQIKTDLDGLRLLVEKSELWVYKAKIATTEADENDIRPIVSGDITKPNGNDEEIDEEGNCIRCIRNCVPKQSRQMKKKL